MNCRYGISVYGALGTETERNKINEYDFDTLWNEMWCKRDGDKTECTRNFSKEMKDSSEKFAMLQKGFYIKLADSDDMIPFNLDIILQSTIAKYSDTEWGFPKGRRNIAENDMTCALREFTEETGIPYKSIRLCNDIKPIEEVFSGSNKVRYKHVYYIGKHVSYSLDNGVPLPTLYNPQNKIQSKEIKDVKWFTYQDAQNLIRAHNVERKELFKRLNNMIMRSLQ